MTNDLPLMPDEVMLEFKITPEHPYYKEIRCLLSMTFILQMTAEALIKVPHRSKYVDDALANSLDDYIEILSRVSADMYGKYE